LRKELAGLRAELQQLVDSHLANPKAIPLDVLEIKQAELEDKIYRAEERLARASGNIDKAQEGLRAARLLLGHASIYMPRRMALTVVASTRRSSRRSPSFRAGLRG
jgi:hypothetical protein